MVRLGDRLIHEVTVPDAAAVTVGEASDCTLVLPGLDGERQILAHGGRVRPVAGMGAGSHPADGAYELPPGESVVLRVARHPDVTVALRRDAAERIRIPRWSGGFMVRELLYGASFAACLLALCAVERPTAAATAAGTPEASGRMARLMMAGPVGFAAAAPSTEAVSTPPSVPVVAEPEPATSPSTAAVADTPAPAVKVVAAALESRPSDPPRPSAEPVAGRDSHTSDGEVAPKGAPSGLAAVDGRRRCDRPRGRPKDHVDVVFAIDVSTTMGFVLDRLAREIEHVDAEVRRRDPSPRYGLVVFVDDVLVTNEGRAFTDVHVLQRELRRWSRFTATNRQLRRATANVDWPENSLDALHAAATRFHWRPAKDTLRLVVHATDDDFGERGDVLSGLGVAHTYVETVEALRASSIRVATFAARIGGSCECDDVSPGWFGPYEGSPSIPDATGGAAFDIDEVIAGRTSLGDAVTATIDDAACSEVPVPWR